MAKYKKSHKCKVLTVWFIILMALLAFMFVATMVLTQVQFLYNTINSVMGGEQRYLKEGDPSQYVYYKSDYSDKNEVFAAANALNERIVEEGIILLKNNDFALPLKEGAKVSVFGRNSVNAVLGGSGSNKGDTSGAVTDVAQALKNGGFDCNTVLHDYYTSLSGYTRPEVSMGSILTGYPICEASLPYPDTVKSSYKNYADAAIVFLSRTGGEGFDLPRTMFWDGSSYKKWDAKNRQKAPGARSADDHYLQLDADETAMIREACDNFDKVVVVVNSASPIELGFLDDPTHYLYTDGDYTKTEAEAVAKMNKIKAALWLGHPGSSGLNALGRVLKGAVNPSGRTVDTYARDFRNDPSWQNFGNYLENDGNRYYTGSKARGAYFVEYREGIYVGYRYYETMAEELDKKDGSGEAWYGDNVVYPFGYGLSYTDFEWSVKTPEDLTLDKDGKITVEATVTNVGSRSGKDVVELYFSAPYEKGGIEKPSVVLGDFVKTELLAAGESKTYTLEMDVRDMASYDYADKNGNGFKGYELEKGAYRISVRKNAHEVVAEFEYALANDVRYEYDGDTKIENLFDDVSGGIAEYLSRADAFKNSDCLKGASDAAHRDVSNEFLNAFTYKYGDKESDPWYSAEPSTQSKSTLSYKRAEIKLYELMGKDYEDELWNKLMDQLTVDQLKTLISVGNYRTLQIENIGKPLTIDSDGPMGFASFMGDGAVYGTCYYASECILAATYNEALAEEFGKMIGNESLIGDEAGDGRTYSGWYAPAVNIHRSQFGGRNFEYYSEDARLSGDMATGVIKGAMQKGVYTYLKHFALNEQETCRDSNGIATWANEQSMRELYLKPFEIAVKKGETTAVMSSFNRLGSTWAGGSYNLLTRLLRDEWGFNGMVITDFNLKDYMNVDQMLRAGGDLNLSPEKGPSSYSSTTDIAVLRRAAKNILYTVANSNAMNGNGEGIIWGYTIPVWVIWLIVATCGLAVACGVLGFFTVREILRCKAASAEGGIAENPSDSENADASPDDFTDNSNNNSIGE